MKPYRKAWKTKAVATVNVALDALDGFEVISKPENPARKIGWCSVPLEGDVGALVDEREALFLLTPENVVGEMRKHPPSLGALILSFDEPYSRNDLAIDKSIEKRLIILRSTRRSATRAENILQAQSLLQITLLKLQQWSAALREIIGNGGNVQDVIDASENIFDNFIDVNDATYSLIAYTKNIEPVDALSRDLIAFGCHDMRKIEAAESIGALKEWREQRDVDVFPADDNVPCPYITAVMRAGDAYAGHVVMVCNGRFPTDGVIDLFVELTSACEQVLQQSSWQQSPQATLLCKIIDDPRISQTYIDEQTEIVGMKAQGNFALYIIDYQNGDFSEQPSWISSMLASAFPDAIIGMHENNLIMLMHKSPVGTEAHRKEVAERLTTFCERRKCLAYASDLFHRLRDARHAYKQAQIARKYKPCIDIELLPLDNIDERRIIHFGEAFSFYLFDHGSDNSEEFLAFCLSHTLLDKMALDDADHTVSDLKLLYHYLFNERKTTPTANQLHMHRNNVLYRIGAIEKKYNIDLDEYETRQRLLNSYRIKIISSSRFRSLLV